MNSRPSVLNYTSPDMTNPYQRYSNMFSQPPPYGSYVQVQRQQMQPPPAYYEDENDDIYEEEEPVKMPIKSILKKTKKEPVKKQVKVEVKKEDTESDTSQSGDDYTDYDVSEKKEDSESEEEYVKPKKSSKIIDKLKERQKMKAKPVQDMTKDELKYASTPVGKAIYQKKLEQEAEKKPKRGRPKMQLTVSEVDSDTESVPQGMIKCIECGKLYSKSNGWRHKKTQYHIAMAKVNSKIRKSILGI